jgi:hypothetical protein
MTGHMCRMGGDVSLYSVLPEYVRHLPRTFSNACVLGIPIVVFILNLIMILITIFLVFAIATTASVGIRTTIMAPDPSPPMLGMRLTRQRLARSRPSWVLATHWVLMVSPQLIEALALPRQLR